MESHVKIKASQKEMEDLFENDEFISVRLYERTDAGLYKCVLRHKELEKPLKGTFTIHESKNCFINNLKQKAMNREERQQARTDRYRELADNARKQSEQCYKQSRSYGECNPDGATRPWESGQELPGEDLEQDGAKCEGFRESGLLRAESGSGGEQQRHLSG